MNRILLIACTIVMFASCSRKTSGNIVTPQPPTPPLQPIVYSFESTPVWQDEFDNQGLPDAAKWGYDIGGHGWGNNELQYYTNSINNAKVENGKLTITTIKEKTEGRNYSSARLVTKNKGDFQYGRVEVKAKLPSGRGTWPAIWMLPTDSDYGTWPKSGEIDIMEHVGFDPNKVHITVHTEAYNHSKGTQKGDNRMVPTAMTDFHLYRVDWAPDSIKGYIDNDPVFTFANQRTGFAAWPFDKRFHIILNTAVGGNWGGAQGIDDTVFPAKFEIDYVRVYKLKQ